jgi:type IV pilus assembly protein PilM
MDVGVNSTKLAQLLFTGGRPILAATWELEPRNGPLDLATFVESGWPDIIDQLASAKETFRGRQLAAALSSTMTDYQCLEIPHGSREEQREMVASELQTDDHDDLARSFDFWETSRTNGNDAGLSQLSVVTVDHTVATALARRLRKIRLTCKTLDATPCALARAAQLMPEVAQGTPVVMIDIGFSTVTVVLAQDGMPKFTRILRDRGVQTWLKAIEAGLNLNAANAAQVLSKVGISPDKNMGHEETLAASVWQMIAAPTDKFIAEIKRTHNFIGERFRTHPPQQIILCGGGALIPNLSLAIHEATHTPVTTWSIPCAEGRGTKQLARYAVAAALSALAWEGHACT